MLRYGQFWGPGTYHEHGRPDPPAIQIDAAATMTMAMLDHPSGIVEITDP